MGWQFRERDRGNSSGKDQATHQLIPNFAPIHFQNTTTAPQSRRLPQPATFAGRAGVSRLIVTKQVISGIKIGHQPSSIASDTPSCSGFGLCTGPVAPTLKAPVSALKLSARSPLMR